MGTGFVVRPGCEHDALSRRHDDVGLRMRGLFHGGSSASLSVEWRLRSFVRYPGQLSPQVSADDHAGQDAQPASQLRSLLGGVPRRSSPRRRGVTL